MAVRNVTAHEEQIIKATMENAADMIDQISNADVAHYQAEMLAAGVPLEKVARLDRAMVASAKLRAWAK